MAPARDDEFLPEVWALYSIGTFWFAMRFAVRLRIDGYRGLRLDDGFAIIALIAWTYTAIIIQITYYTGTNSDFTAPEVALFDQKKLDEVEYGSKLFLGSWYMYLVLIFSLKGMVVVLYRRIFLELWQVWILRITIAICLSGFSALILALGFVCIPYRQRWQIVPPPPLQCTASPQILITSSCVNAVTDVLLLGVPVPLLWMLQKPLRTRIAIFVLLASGLFVLAACITRVALTVVPDIFVLNIARWGIREFCIGIVAVNSASLRPIIRKSFWTRRSPAQQPLRNRHNFDTVQGAHQHLNRPQHRNRVLNSMSVGASNIEYVQQDLGDADSVYEDLDCQSTVHHMTVQTRQPEDPLVSAQGHQSGGFSNPVWGFRGEEWRRGDIDLENGAEVSTKVVRTDSRLPQAGDDVDKDVDVEMEIEVEERHVVSVLSKDQREE